MAPRDTSRPSFLLALVAPFAMAVDGNAVCTSYSIQAFQTPPASPQPAVLGVAINDRGAICGHYLTVFGGDKPFAGTRGSLVNPLPLPTSHPRGHANGINDNGQV